MSRSGLLFGLSFFILVFDDHEHIRGEHSNESDTSRLPLFLGHQIFWNIAFVHYVREHTTVQKIISAFIT